MNIHPTAVVHSGARLSETVAIGPYAVVEDGVEIGAQTMVGAHAVIRSGTLIGEHCKIDSHAVIGGLPQDLHFDPATRSGVRLGTGVVVREGVTIHRATKPEHFTEVGDAVYLMAYAHVGHDCVIGAHAIVANNVMLAGFVSIGAYAFLGGGAAFHQHARIGESAMISGLSRAGCDVPPFSMMAERNELIGLNLVGMKRRGFSRERIRSVKLAFRSVCGEPGNFRERAANYLSTRTDLDEVERRFLGFFAESRRGFVQPTRKLARDTLETE